MYEQLSLYIDGQFISGGGRAEQDVINPATLEVLARLPHATQTDLDLALTAAQRAFTSWRDISPIERSRILRQAAKLIRERAEIIGRNITLDEGKTLQEAVAEVSKAAENVDWHAEECRRIYGRVIPPRQVGVRQLVVREPVGVCVAFTPWNFPFSQAIRKISAALGAGCTLILKGSEESPSAVVSIARIFHEAGVPPGVLNIVWGIPDEIASYLIASPIVRKLSFTGSVPVGRHLAALAGAQLKRISLELGGHSPAIIFPDADVDKAAEFLARFKIRNAGQLCVSPSRFYVHESVYERFLSRFVDVFRSIRVGNGFDVGVDMGPLSSARRIKAVEDLVENARNLGAKVLIGGHRLEKLGYFYAPTVLTEVPDEALILNEEPFGPVAPILSFNDTNDVIARANSLPYGLSAYVFTSSLRTATDLGNALESGMVHINQVGGYAEIPFGGVKDSGIGSEGGSETFDAYLNTKFIYQA